VCDDYVRVEVERDKVRDKLNLLLLVAVSNEVGVDISHIFAMAVVRHDAENPLLEANQRFDVEGRRAEGEERRLASGSELRVEVFERKERLRETTRWNAQAAPA